MRSIKYGHCIQMSVLGLSICGALFVVLDVTFIAPKVVRSYDNIMKPPTLERSRAEFEEDFGYWVRSRETLYISFVIPPIIGFALAIALRRHIRNLLLKNQEYFSRDMQRSLLRWDGVGLKELREEISSLPRLLSILLQLLPLGTVIIILFLFESLVFPGRYTSVPVAFLTTCGFISYPTWKQIFADTTSPQASD